MPSPKTGVRLCYSALPMLAWLGAHTTAGSCVLTYRNELHFLDARLLGASYGSGNAGSSASVRRAREGHADFAAAPWKEPGAGFCDGDRSMIAAR